MCKRILQSVPQVAMYDDDVDMMGATGGQAATISKQRYLE